MGVLRENKPTADVLMNSMRSMGYSFESAVADIVDNSISAGARNIQLYFPVDPNEVYVAICDDGCGMSTDELFAAMTYGSSLKRGVRDKNDLGRFGLGLKAASLSQCRRLTVISKKDGSLSGCVWDIRTVKEKKEWFVEILEKHEINNLPHFDFLDDKRHGTVVIWQEFDVVEKSNGQVFSSLKKFMLIVSQYLSLIFHRYIGESGSNSVHIFVNNFELKPLDPFLEKHPKTTVAREIIINMFDDSGKEHKVVVQPYILPYIRDLSDEDKKLSGGFENYRSKQGFYIYRNRRLIVWGTWFGKQLDELTKYARIRVDIPNTLDDIWGVDIKKQSASIPAAVKAKLTKSIKEAMDISSSKETYRGRKENPNAKIDYIWNRIVNRENNCIYQINRKSKIFDILYDKLTNEQKGVLDVVLSEIENSLPYQQIYIDKSQNKVENLCDDERLAEVRGLAEMLVCYSVEKGESRDKAIEELMLSEPFCLHKELRRVLYGEVKND